MGVGKGQLGLAGELGQRSSFLGRLSELCGPQSAARPDTNEGAWLCSRPTPGKSGDQWLLAPELRREEGPEVAGLPPRNRSGLGAWGLPSCKVAGALGPEACFSAGLPARAQQLRRPPRLSVPSPVRQGCGRDPLGGRRGLQHDVGGGSDTHGL